MKKKLLKKHDIEKMAIDIAISNCCKESYYIIGIFLLSITRNNLRSWLRKID